MSNHSNADKNPETVKDPEQLQSTEDSENQQNFQIKENQTTDEKTNDIDTQDADDVTSGDNNNPLAEEYVTKTSTKSPTPSISGSPKLSSISAISILSTLPETQLLTPSHISRISLKTFQLCTTTPPNSNATSSWNMLDLILKPPPPSRLVLCVGLCVLDIVHICEEFPRERAKQLLATGYWQRGGNASNNCTVLRNLGAECEFLGVMSKLPAFAFLKDDCHNRGIAIENCPLVDMYPPFSSILACRPTGTFTIIQTNLGFPILKFQHFKEKIKLHNYSWIHFEARNAEETKPMINMIRRYNADLKSETEKPLMISLELAKSDKTLLSLAMRVNLLFIGREFALNMGWSTPKDTVYNLRELISFKQLREDKEPNEMDICFRCPHIVCPWGSEGCSLLTASYEFHHIPALEVDHIVDAKGSGDTFVATIIYAMNNLDFNLKDAVKLGCEVAVFKMQHQGLDCIKDYVIVDNKSEIGLY